jgi:cobalt transporter subunit CbtA
MHSRVTDGIQGMLAFRGIVLSAAIAGFVVGLLISLVQQLGTASLILRSEVYERAAAVESSQTALATAHDHANSAEHQQPAWEPADGWERTTYSVAANVVTAIGFALLLCGAYALYGGKIGWRTGLFWGLSGFVVFVGAPSLSLPPTLPGIPTADLGARQVWWIATAALTALGLGLVAFRRSTWAMIFALIVLLAPHVIGAPHPLVAETSVPAALAREFVFAVIFTGLLFWALLGSLTGALYRRLSQ